MNSPAHWVSILSMIIHLTIGLTELFRIGPRFLPPSWAELYALVPFGEWLYPSSYVLVGIMASLGIWKSRAIQWTCCISAAVFFIWGILGLYSMIHATGGNIQGAFANFYTTGLALFAAYAISVISRKDRTNQLVTKLQDEVDKT